jgi:two-component system chemotaxis response regulator CheY
MKSPDRTLPALVVDDSRTMCEIMSRVLRQIGFAEVEHATEALDAISKLTSKPYGLLLTDLEMNPISGPDLIKMIWAEKEIARMPTILTSSNRYSIAKTVSDTEGGIADIYILKPFTAEILDRKLHETFGE